MSRHDDLYDLALKAIERLFGDTSVPQDTTRRSLNALRDEVQIKLDCLPESDREV